MKKREEIDEKYKWNLTTIFKSDEEWNKEFGSLSKDIKNITKFKDKITTSSSNLYEFLKFSEKIDRRLSKLYYYANLKSDEDTSNTYYQSMHGKALNLLKEYSSISSFADPELLKCSYNKIKKYIKENKKLLEYKFYLENIFRYKKHILSSNEEKILSNLSNVLNASEDAYTSLIYSDIKFDNIKDEDKKTVSLNQSNYSKYLTSNDRNVRKQAFLSMYKSFENNKNVVSSLFNSHFETLIELAKLRKFNSSIEASLFSDNINLDVYNNLIKAVSDNLKTIYKYYDLKKRVLKLKELHLYDVYAPLIKEVNKKYTFEEAKELIFKALKPLGEDYLKNLKKTFDERWIDVYYTEGKRTGAYSSGNYDVNPFILLNFENDLNSVSTLAHELGHSMHTYYSCKNNTYINSSYKIFVAEVASTVNEILLCKYLIDNSEDKNERLYAINELMELFRATIYRQTMFAEFEKNMSKLKEDGETLTNDLLCSNYYELNKKYFGENVVIDSEIKYEWERIPHFYYNFYVYKYATSLSISASVANDIYNNKKDVRDKYLNFLKLGGSDYPLNELKTINIDASKSDVIKNAIKIFDKLIDKFDEEVKK